MSDAIQVDLPKERTIDDVKQEYTNLCVQAGNLQYQADLAKQDLVNIFQRMKQLNVEASEIVKKSEAKAE